MNISSKEIHYRSETHDNHFNFDFNIKVLSEEEGKFSLWRRKLEGVHPSIITCEELRAGVDKSDLNKLVSAVEGERLSTSGKRKVRHFFIGTILACLFFVNYKSMFYCLLSDCLWKFYILKESLKYCIYSMFISYKFYIHSIFISIRFGRTRGRNYRKHFFHSNLKLFG